MRTRLLVDGDQYLDAMLRCGYENYTSWQSATLNVRSGTLCSETMCKSQGHLENDVRAMSRNASVTIARLIRLYKAYCCMTHRGCCSAIP